MPRTNTICLWYDDSAEDAARMVYGGLTRVVTLELP